MSLYRFPLAVLVTLLPVGALADSWTVDPEASKISYTYNWSGTEAGGDFQDFAAEIKFDKHDLPNASVRVMIRMASVSAAYSQVPAELVKPEWFDVDQFPEAIFESTSFAASEDGTYTASGTLTMKGVSHPSELVFRFDSYGPVPNAPNTLQAVMSGETTLSRTAYEVGQGSWSATDTLADEVKVTVNLTANQSTAP